MTFEKDILDRLTRIETTVTRMERQLFGNGQPGVIADITTQVNGLERFRSRIVGIGITVSLLLSSGLVTLFLNK